MCLFQFWFPQCVCPAVGLLGHKAALFAIFKGISTLFSIVAVLVCIPTNSIGGFPFLHTLSSIYCLQIFGSQRFWLVWMVPHCGLDLHFSDNEWCWAFFHVFVSHLYVFFEQYLGFLSIFFFCQNSLKIVSGLCFFHDWLHEKVLFYKLNGTWSGKPYLLTFSIQCWCSFIQQQDAGVSDEGSGDSNPLFLPPGKLSPLVSHSCFIFLQVSR